MSYISPAIQDQFQSLSPDLKDLIVQRNVDLNNMQDLIYVLEQIVDEEENTTPLPMRALNEVPSPRSDAQAIIGLVKNSGKVTGYQLSSGTIVDKMQGVTMAKQGEIRGVGIAHRNGTEYLKSIPDGTENNNLSNLPSVSI